MKSFVISLPARPDRRDVFKTWNAHQPVPFKFVPAAEGWRLDRQALVSSGILDADNRHFNPGALGNALSHRALWEECARGREPYLIFEDDCCLRGDFWRHAQPIMARQAVEHDLIVFGFNTDAAIAVRSADGVFSAIRFDESVKYRPGYFEQYARLRDGRPNLFRCHQFWGILAYAVSPKGARRLLDLCFPLASREPIRLIGDDRAILPYGLDGSINLALQQGKLDTLICYPPLALGPNSHATSDIQTAIRA
ncbi:glycosyltransferase family 25 protein [Kaistia dalseonensis]|uniref:GR25 family glycosyltransferase involved in LPS biosynthesis n=1 Tax=Kaistia dalseonensis TaxID=410840 RepID=A0ABU0H9G0_9HYPH|nr:glycosyltransferase family 25 protein [Kaistia dalseonensis]MCX5496333.1 glycosyltransferase family 25 protein [Kaistia dalseonensis]MDQ0438952.1 GR25 family glycosyltransferase involved in LPS biosynthesis [Kaistia dalseonensis]